MENRLKNPLNVTVSCFRNCVTADHPRPVNLLTWLTSDKYANKVAAIRKITDKAERDKMKKQLPAITPSGTFNYRSEERFCRHSGLLQFDIDKKDNEHLTNYAELKAQLRKLANVAYCGLSVSGTGYWGLVPIAEPEKHKEHFSALLRDFATLGIQLDPAPASISLPRVYSFDPDAYFNPSATVYKRLFEPVRTVCKPFKTGFMNGSGTAEGKELWLQERVKEVLAQRLDLTGNYHDWFRIGAALACELGEKGREYFHQLSQFHPDYDPAKTDRQYNHCLKNRYGYTWGTLYFYLKG